MLASEKENLIDKAKKTVKSVAIPAAVTNQLGHLNLQDLSRDLQVKLKNAGSQTYRSDAETAMMLQKIPAPFRTSIEDIKLYLQDKDASHINARAKGGSDHPSNLIWENSSKNRARGGENMSALEGVTNISQNVTSSLKMGAIKGLQEAPRGAAIAVVTAMPITFLKYSFAVARGEMTKEDAAKAAVLDIAVQGAIGGASTALIVMLCTLCPPLVALLATLSPLLLSVGIGGMIFEYYSVIEQNKDLFLSWLSKNREQIESATVYLQALIKQTSPKSDEVAIKQIREIQFKSQFGLKFWLQWIVMNFFSGLVALFGTAALTKLGVTQEISGLIGILLISCSVGFSQWFMLKLRCWMGLKSLTLNIIVSLVALLLAFIVASSSGATLGFLTFFSITAVFAGLAINRALPREASFA
jgi:hypothetical protein